MLRNRFNLEEALGELRQETPSDDAKRRARLALLASPKRRTWRTVAVIAGLTVLVLPIALKSEGTGVYASEVMQATASAKYVITRSYDIRPGKPRVLVEECLFGPDRSVERTFFSRSSLQEVRHLPGLKFTRYLYTNPYGFLPYESVEKSDKSAYGVEGHFRDWSVSNLERVLGGGRKLSPVGSEHNGLQLYRIPGSAIDLTVEVATKRLVRMAMHEKGRDYVHEHSYPDSIDPNRLNIPPLGWTWKDDFNYLSFPDPGPLLRFNLSKEREQMLHWYREGQRVATVGGKKVKLVGAFQCMTVLKKTVFLIYQAGEPRNDRKHPARATGLGRDGVTTMHVNAPKILATTYSTDHVVKEIDAKVPVYGKPGQFLGYATFPKVPVLQYSQELFSGLRDMPGR